MIEDISRRGYIKKVTDKSQIPENAIHLTEKDAIQTQLDILYNWKNKKEIWPFEQGQFILAAAAGLGGLGLNFYYRRKLNLGSLAKYTTYMPAIVLPSILAPIFHSVFITSDVLIKKSSCSLCVELRSAILQGTAGAIYPLFITPLAAFHYADANYTYAIPPIKTHFKDIIKLWWKFTKPVIFPHVLLLFMFQAVVAKYITKKQAEVIQKLNDFSDYSNEFL